MNTKTITIPSSMNELTLEKFCESYQLINNPKYKYNDGTPSELFWVQYIHILTKIPMEDLENMEYQDYLGIKNKVVELKFEFPELQDPNPFDKKELIIEHKGKRFIFQPDYGYTKLKTAMVIEDLMGDKDFLEHLYIVAGVGFIEVDENDKPYPFIPENLDKKSEFWLDCPISKLYSTLFFCSNQDRNSTFFINRYGRMNQNTQRWTQALMQQGVLTELDKFAKSGDGEESETIYKKIKSLGTHLTNRTKR